MKITERVNRFVESVSDKTPKAVALSLVVLGVLAGASSVARLKGRLKKVVGGSTGLLVSGFALCLLKSKKHKIDETEMDTLNTDWSLYGKEFPKKEGLVFPEEYESDSESDTPDEVLDLSEDEL